MLPKWNNPIVSFPGPVPVYHCLQYELGNELSLNISHGQYCLSLHIHASKVPTPGFQKSSANTTVEAAVRVKPGNREANKCYGAKDVVHACLMQSM